MTVPGIVPDGPATTLVKGTSPRPKIVVDVVKALGRPAMMIVPGDTPEGLTICV